MSFEGIFQPSEGGFRSVFSKVGLQCVSSELVKPCQGGSSEAFLPKDYFRMFLFKGYASIDRSLSMQWLCCVVLPKGITELSFRMDLRKDFLKE